MFVRGGIVYPGLYLDAADYYGTYWSSVGLTSSDAYFLYFNPGGVDPSSNRYRYRGQSIRCVALGG